MTDTEKKRGYRQRRVLRDPDYKLLLHFRKKGYKFTVAEYREQVERQGNVCAICSNPPPEDGRLDPDHCHETGKLRGALCRGCNVAIGHLRDSPLTAFAACMYLRT